MLTCPSVHSAYPRIHFRIMRIVNALSQKYINRKFQKYISVSSCHCNRASFMRPFFIAFKNAKWCHFVVRIGSPALISLYFVYFVSFYFSLFSYFFVRFLSGVSRNGLLQPLVMNITSLVQFGKNLSYILSALAS